METAALWLCVLGLVVERLVDYGDRAIGRRDFDASVARWARGQFRGELRAPGDDSDRSGSADPPAVGDR